MGQQDYRSPILTFVGLCFFILSIAQNADTLPYNVDGTDDTDQLLDIVEKSTNSEATEASVERDPRDHEEWSDNGYGPQRRDRRGFSDRFSRTSARSFTDFQDMQSDAKIVFPDEDTRRQVPVCKGSTYCEEVDNYPEHIVTEALQRNESLKYLEVFDEVSDIVQRINVDDDIPICVSTEHLVHPRAGKTKDNQWQFIANQEDFKQAVRIELCRTENATCNAIIPIGEGYKTTCVQKYMYRPLVAILPDKSVVQDMFMFPSSCCCYLSFTGSPFTRMGSFGEQRSNATTHIQTRMRK